MMTNNFNKNGVILIHGFTSTPQAIIDLAEKIHKENFKVFLPKLPGHCTKWKDLTNITFEDWINTLENKALKLLKTSDKINIIGLSMGGTLGAILAEKLGEKANTLTLI
ncbi:alpha/beta fold hydrolase, partial [Candidatus Dependentiae bacterium]|nr:alpha/beta fold hydrolase [Candidatus Dependentiae bacterium]